MPVTIDGSNTPTAGGVVYGDGTEYASTSAGTSGQVLVSGGAGAPTWSAAPTSSQWTTSGSNIYYNTGSVGIGTSSPSTKLHVVGINTGNRGQLCVQSDSAGNEARITMYDGTDYIGEFATAGTSLYAYSAGNLLLYAGGTQRFVVGSSGQLGIGTSPSYGTSGQVLTSGGSGAAPTWSTPSSGALVLLSTQTVSSAVATVDFSNLFTSTYDDYVVYFGGVTSTDNYPLCVRLQKNGSFGNAGYNWDYVNGRSSGTAQTSASVAATQINFGPTATLASNNIQGGFCTITNANSATGYAVSVVAQVFSHSTSASSVGMMTAGGTSQAAFVTTGIQFLFTTGNVTAGTFRLYGVAK